MDSLGRIEQRRERKWAKLQAMRPNVYELESLLMHLRWLRLSPEAKLRTEYLPGMGRRRGDR